MALTLNGIGTTFYGQSNFLPDGTFQTTKWFVFCFFPVIPLETCRVARNTRADKNAIVYSSEGYYLISNLPIGYAQVFRTYAFAILYAIFAFSTSWLFLGKFDMFGQTVAVMLALLAGYISLLGLPFVALSRWRMAAFRAVHKAALSSART